LDFLSYNLLRLQISLSSCIATRARITMAPPPTFFFPASLFSEACPLLLLPLLFLPAPFSPTFFSLLHTPIRMTPWLHPIPAAGHFIPLARSLGFPPRDPSHLLRFFTIGPPWPASLTRSTAPACTTQFDASALLRAASFLPLFFLGSFPSSHHWPPCLAAEFSYRFTLF